jgi:mRNA interferase MazF
VARVTPPRRGDVYWVALDPTLGSEIRKTRPAIIVSNDSCNTYGTRVVVMPITSNATTLYPGEALVRLKGKPARALGDQIRSIDKARLRQRIGRLNREELAQVGTALQITLGLAASAI